MRAAAAVDRMGEHVCFNNDRSQLRCASSKLPSTPACYLLQALELDTLLAGGATVAAGGVRTVSHRGVGLYDVLALKDELMKR